MKACRISFRQVRTFQVSTFQVSTFQVSTLSGRPANVGEENVDVGIRLGEIRDKSSIAAMCFFDCGACPSVRRSSRVS
jgi:hypothetical protein